MSASATQGGHKKRRCSEETVRSWSPWSQSWGWKGVYGKKDLWKRVTVLQTVAQKYAWHCLRLVMNETAVMKTVQLMAENSNWILYFLARRKDSLWQFSGHWG